MKQITIEKEKTTIRSYLQQLELEEVSNNLLISVDNVIERDWNKELSKGQTLTIIPAVAGG